VTKRIFKILCTQEERGRKKVTIASQ